MTKLRCIVLASPVAVSLALGCVATPQRIMRDAGEGSPQDPPLATASGNPTLCSSGAPTPGVTTSVQYQFRDVQFRVQPPPEPLSLEVFAGAPLTLGECALTDCVVATTDAQGAVSINLAADAWFSVRIRGTEQIRESIAYQLIAPPSGPAQSVFITNALAMTSADIVGRTPRSGTTSLSGAIVDCAGEPIGNVALRLYRGTERIEHDSAASDGPFFAYYQGPLPVLQTPSSRTTSVAGEGRFIAGNLPVEGEGPLRLEAWGSTAAGAPMARIACEELPWQPDSTTIVTLRPLRNDYPAGSGCDQP